MLCAGCLCRWRLEFSVFTSTGRAMQRAATKSFSSSATKTSVIDVCPNQRCGAGFWTAVDQLKVRHGAIVVLNPQTGEVLALYSEPSYSLKEVDDEATWIKLDNDKRDKPLVNRALNEYYVPGSTFKTLMMITAFRNGMQNIRFNTSGGFSPQGCAKTITDDNGACEACGDIGIDAAYQHSSNIYFSYLGTQLGGEKIRDTARLLGLGAYDSTAGEGQGRREPEIWNASTDAVKRAIAPTEALL